jgi:DNA-binding NarL/FixJ family response regulator
MQASAKPAIRVLVVDDHFFTRMGIRAALSIEGDMGVVAEASCGREAIDCYCKHLPDVAVLDGHLPDMHGSEVAREIVKRFEGAKLLLFSVEGTEEDIHRAEEAGVSGYVSKNADRSELVQAVRVVASGRRYFSEAVLAKLRERRARVGLSEREMQVLDAMSRGLPNKLIACELGLSPETVKTFVARLLQKLDAEDRTLAVVRGFERGLLKR